MDDLRIGLVEAMMEAESLHGFTEQTRRLLAEDLLAVALGFLTDNAEAWAESIAVPEKAWEIGSSVPAALIAALRVRDRP